MRAHAAFFSALCATALTVSLATPAVAAPGPVSNALSDAHAHVESIVGTSVPLAPELIAAAEGADAAIAGYNKQVPPGFRIGDDTLKETGDAYQPIAQGPNYRWSDSPADQLGAMTLGPVLHRVETSQFHGPDTPLASILAERDGNSLYGPGTPIYVGQGQLCTVGAVGTDAQGNKIAITAGHCAEVGDTVVSADSWRVGTSGVVVSKNAALDYAVIRLGSNATITPSYNDLSFNEIGEATPVPVADVLGVNIPRTVQVDHLCKTGVATGTTCSISWLRNESTNLNQLCAMRGDSGAPVYIGKRLVGMISGGMVARGECVTPWQGPLHSPTVSTSMPAVVADMNANGGAGAGFKLAQEVLQ